MTQNQIQELRNAMETLKRVNPTELKTFFQSTEYESQILLSAYKSASYTKEDKDAEEKLIGKVLRQLGIPAHIKGYSYLKTAIRLVREDRTYLDYVTYRLYVDIAKCHDTTGSRAERAIRHAIEVAATRSAGELFYTLFGSTMDSNKGKPTNSEFIAGIYEFLQ